MPNPSTIMGAAALDFWDIAATDSLWQNSDGTTAVADGNPVGRWTGQLSNRNLIQPNNDTTRPLYEETAQAHLLFDGSNDWIEDQSGYSGAGFYFIGRLYVPASAADGGRVLMCPKDFQDFGAGGNINTFINGANLGFLVTGLGFHTRPMPRDQWFTLEIGFTASNFLFSIDGNDITATGTYTAPIFERMTIAANRANPFGATNIVSMRSARIAITSAIPDATQRAALLDWAENGDTGGGGTEIAGEGAAALVAVSASGSGARSVSGAGAAAILPTQATGQGARAVTGSGAAILPFPPASGAAKRVVTASGAASIQSPEATGTATRAITGTGATTLPGTAATGAANRNVTGEGASTLPSPSVAGSGTVGSNINATGAVELPGSTAQGAAVRGVNGSGAGDIAAPTASGAAQRQVTGSGAGSLPSVSAFGSSGTAVNITGLGAASIAPTEASGVSVRIITGAGVAVLPAANAESVTSREITGQGAAIIPMAQASGAVTRAIGGSGAVVLPVVISFGTQADLSARRVATPGQSANGGRLTASANGGRLIQSRNGGRLV